MGNIVCTVQWVSEFREWLGTVPAGIWGAFAGAVSARILTWVAERKRNRDTYRAPQRGAIGAIIAAANDMKVSLSDAIEHMGLTRRQTTDDAAVQSLNTFLRRLLALDEQFSIGRLTIVDGPCRDKMIAAYLRYSELRKLANNPNIVTANGFGEFVREMNDTTNDLDVLIAELIDLAEERLSPARPLLSKRPESKVASNKARPKAPAEHRICRRRSNAAASDIQGTEAPSRPDSDPPESGATTQGEELEVDAVGESAKVHIRRQVITGAQLTPEHVGRLVAQGRGNHNVMGKILAIAAAGPDSWIVTVHWAALPGQRPSVERARVRFTDPVELVEVLKEETEKPEGNPGSE